MSRFVVALLTLLWGMPAALLPAEQEPTEWRNAISRVSELRKQHQHSEAESVLLDLWKEAKRSNPDSEWVAAISYELGVFYYELGRESDAEQFYVQAVSFWTEHKPTYMSDQAAAVNSLAVLYLDQYRHESARQLYRRYQSGWLAALHPEHVEIASSWGNLGTISFQRGEFAKAEEFWGKAVAVWEKNPDAERTQLMALLNNLGVVYSNTGRLDKALEVFKRMLALRAAGSGVNDLALIRSSLNVAGVYCLMKRFDESVKYYDNALEEALNTLGPEHPLSAITATEYSSALRLMKRNSEAKHIERLARMLRDTSSASNQRFTVSVNELKAKTR